MSSADRSDKPLVKMNKLSRLMVDLDFKLDKFFNKKRFLNGRSFRGMWLQLSQSSHPRREHFDYVLSLWGFKRCENCNGYGFHKKQEST